VLVVIVYYVLNVACEFLVTMATLPPFAGAWLPNGIFSLTTAVWFYVMSRR
jgi:lipopolysaccharide export system permease protein